MLAYSSEFMQIDPQIVFYIVVLIVSIILHEVAHGYVALWFGDRTAQRAGRLTLNPVPHIDLFGSILLPGILVLTNAGIYFGWAKPVPYNPANLTKGRWSEAAVASAGILVNIAVAVIFAALAAAALVSGNESFAQGALLVAQVNLSLGIFNLLPLPPFDGFKVFKSLAPSRLFMSLHNIENRIRRYEFLVLIVVIFAFMTVVGPLFRDLIQFLLTSLVRVWL
jgi:Zn-dependent protease